MDIINFIKSKASNNNGTLIKTIKNDKLLKSLLIEKTFFLDESATISQRLYHIIHELHDVPKCRYCNNQVKFKGVKYLIFCDKKCAAKYNNGIKELKIKKSNVISEKYKLKTADEKQEIKDKRTETLLLKYGVKHNFDIDRDKIKRTNLEKYGHTSPSANQDVKDKIKRTNLEKYGVEHYSMSTKYKESFKETCIKKYGVEHYMKLDEYLTKCYSYKDLIMPSGKIRKVQGYEDFIILNLLNDGFAEDDIVTDLKEINKCTGIINYTYNGIKRRYYPDIYIKSLNTLIEVKSEYTYNKQKKKTELKLEAANASGFNTQLKIINKKDYDKFKNQKCIQK